jgi:anaerobic selenocysteine-containing dehydrogenase
VQFGNVFPQTPDGRVTLWSDALDHEAPVGLYGYQADPATEAYPLALISPASERTVSSTLGEIDRPRVRLEIHPDDARARGIADGDDVEIVNELGSVACSARVTPLVRPGTVAFPKGVWRRHTANGLTSNALVPDRLTDLGGGACFNDARVQVVRAPSQQ